MPYIWKTRLPQKQNQPGWSNKGTLSNQSFIKRKRKQTYSRSCTGKTFRRSSVRRRRGSWRRTADRGGRTAWSCRRGWTRRPSWVGSCGSAPTRGAVSSSSCAEVSPLWPPLASAGRPLLVAQTGTPAPHVNREIIDNERIFINTSKGLVFHLRLAIFVTLHVVRVNFPISWGVTFVPVVSGSKSGTLETPQIRVEKMQDLFI